MIPYVAEISVASNPEVAYLEFPILIGIYCTCIPFYIGIFHTFKLIRFINRENVFTKDACRSLKAITISALAVITLYSIGLIYLRIENALPPALLLLGITIIFASFVIAVFSAVLKALLMKVIAIKNDNDLTI